MKIAILADIHDNLPNLKRCLDWCRHERVSRLVVCGDLTSRRTAAYLAANFSGPIFIISGNGELYKPEELAAYNMMKHCGAVGRESIGELNIGFCHEPAKIQRLLDGGSPRLDFIFYGHTHKPWLEKRNGTYVANPGNLAGIYYPATFALLETKKRHLELKALNDLAKP